MGGSFSIFWQNVRRIRSGPSKTTQPRHHWSKPCIPLHSQKYPGIWTLFYKINHTSIIADWFVILVFKLSKIQHWKYAVKSYTIHLEVILFSKYIFALVMGDKSYFIFGQDVIFPPGQGRWTPHQQLGSAGGFCLLKGNILKVLHLVWKFAVFFKYFCLTIREKVIF